MNYSIDKTVVTRMYHVFTNFPWGTNDNFVHITASQYAETALVHVHDWMIWSTVRTVLPKHVSYRSQKTQTVLQILLLKFPGFVITKIMKHHNGHAKKSNEHTH